MGDSNFLPFTFEHFQERASEWIAQGKFPYYRKTIVKQKEINSKSLSNNSVRPSSKGVISCCFLYEARSLNWAIIPCSSLELCQTHFNRQKQKIYFVKIAFSRLMVGYLYERGDRK